MSRRSSVAKFAVLAIMLFSSVLASAAADSPRETAIKLVAQVRAADYEGDRPALARLYAELAPFVNDSAMGSRVRYWRGFALWRRALNGFNETVDPKEQQHDLEQAAREFESAVTMDPKFSDARAAAVSCIGFLIGYFQGDPARIEELRGRAGPLRKQAGEEAPDNPRYLWVMGTMLWYIPPERGGGQDKSIEAYEKGLASARKLKGSVTDPLEPSWGEPECLMGLALASLNRAAPDLNAAEQYAQSALALVPNWHYVRDILMKQIRDAKANQAGKTSP